MWLVVVPAAALACGGDPPKALLDAVLSSEYFEGATAVVDRSESLDLAKARRCAEATVRRNLLEFAPVTSGGRVFDADAAAQRRISGATMRAMIQRQAWLVAAVEALAEGTSTALPIAHVMAESWTLADDSVVEMTEGSLLDLATDVIAQVSGAHGACRRAKTEIESALSQDQVAAVELPELP